MIRYLDKFPRNELKQQFKSFGGNPEMNAPQPGSMSNMSSYTPYYFPVPYSSDINQNYPYVQYTKESPVIFQVPEAYQPPNQPRIYQRAESPIGPPGDNPTSYQQPDLRKRPLSPEKIPAKFHPYMTNAPDRKQIMAAENPKPPKRNIPEFLPAMPIVGGAIPTHSPEMMMYSLPHPHPLAQFPPYLLPQVPHHMVYMPPSLPAPVTNGEGFTIPTITTCRPALRNQE